jgi:hypothetical protein
MARRLTQHPLSKSIWLKGVLRMAHSDLEAVTKLSVVLTGFSAFRLRGTGLLEVYTTHLASRMGPKAFAALCEAVDQLSEAADTSEKDRILRHAILSDACLGPAARSLLKMWYVGVPPPTPKGCFGRPSEPIRPALRPKATPCGRGRLVFPIHRRRFDRV